jgi:hypothetical protein
LLTFRTHYDLRSRFGNAVTDNASENGACIDLIAQDLKIDAKKRHVLCMGHVINLVAHKVLFGTDAEAFEQELEGTVTTEMVELNSWRKKGPIGKLHNLIRYINHSPNRRDVFLGLQPAVADPLRDHPESQKEPLHLIRDDLTRWNSWYDAAERALLLRNAIDEFVDQELLEYHQAVVRHERRFQLNTASQKDPPKAPTVLYDKLSVDDWEVIKLYMKLLKPCKHATMQLQGNVSTTTQRGRAIKGAIWQVLPIYGELLKVFEEARQDHLPVESQSIKVSLPASSPPTSPSSIAPRTTRNSQQVQYSRVCATTDEFGDSISSVLVQPVEQQSRQASDAESNSASLTSQHHFNHNINAAWQKLDYYYNLSDDTPIYRAAVFLHPRMKWRWFERHWELPSGLDHQRT